jgi:dTMP kinase
VTRTEARFVTLEGIDGSGKSTLLRALTAALDERPQIRYHRTREETETWLGEAVKRSIRDQCFPLATCYLFLADRAQHLSRLAPHFRDGHLVLSDRYHDSTRAYQAVTLGETFGGIEAYEAWLRIHTDPWLLHPVRTYLLDVDPQVACQRLAAGRDDTTPYEKEGFLSAVRDQYLRIAHEEPERILVLDGEKDTEGLVHDVLTDLETIGLI